MSGIVPPGSTIGVLGSGQLGRMFTIAARQMGYRVHVLSPDDDTPTGQVADLEIRAAYDDQEAVARFASAVDVVTFEFENIPLSTAETAIRYAPVHPAGRVLHTTQNRIREKEFLQLAGLPVTPFVPVRSISELTSAVKTVGFPAVLKTAEWGYDGKGQIFVESAEQSIEAWRALGQKDAVLERWIQFNAEVSVLAARSAIGELVCYDPFQNVHRNHILDLSSSPADITSDSKQRATEIARSIMILLDVIGVLCIEFFVLPNGDVMINELAPRPHNSGHLTIDAHATSQFEQQVRAVCGLPLGSTDQLRPAAMVNILGELWEDGSPDWNKVLTHDDVKLHLYGKKDAKPGRKMGHLTSLSDTAQLAIKVALAARRRLCND